MSEIGHLPGLSQWALPCTYTAWRPRGRWIGAGGAKERVDAAAGGEEKRETWRPESVSMLEEQIRSARSNLGRFILCSLTRHSIRYPRCVPTAELNVDGQPSIWSPSPCEHALRLGWKVDDFARYFRPTFPMVEDPKWYALLMHNRLYLHYKDMHIIYLTWN